MREHSEDGPEAFYLPQHREEVGAAVQGGGRRSRSLRPALAAETFSPSHPTGVEERVLELRRERGLRKEEERPSSVTRHALRVSLLPCLLGMG